MERSGEFPGWRAETRRERDAEEVRGQGGWGEVSSGPGSPRMSGQGHLLSFTGLEWSRAGLCFRPAEQPFPAALPPLIEDTAETWHLLHRLTYRLLFNSGSEGAMPCPTSHSSI